MAHRDINIPARTIDQWKNSGEPTQVTPSGQMGNGDTCTWHYSVPRGVMSGDMVVTENPDLGGRMTVTLKKPDGSTTAPKSETQSLKFAANKAGDYALTLKQEIADGTSNYDAKLTLVFPK